jgi:hypothetical protein
MCRTMPAQLERRPGRLTACAAPAAAGTTPSPLLRGVCLLISGAAAGCAADLDPGRLVTLDTGVIEPGTNEVDLSTNASRAGERFDDHGDPHGRGGARSQVTGIVTAIHGVLKDLDLSITGGWTSIHDEAEAAAGRDGASSAFIDAEISARWRWATIGTAELALVPIVTIPTGTVQPHEGLPAASDRWHAGAALVATWYLDPAILGAHVRYDRHLTDGMVSDRDSLVVSTAVGVQVLRWLQPEVELTYDAARPSTSPSPISSLLVTGGAQTHPSAHVRIGAGGQVAIAGRSSDRTWSFIAVAAIGF